MATQRLSARERGYTWQWQKSRAAYLQYHPLCAMCADEGRTTPAVLVDHIIPHRGDQGLFWDARNWQPLCRSCHDVEKKTLENRAHRPVVGLDGWPVGDNAPLERVEIEDDVIWPRGLRPSALPLTIVCGPPCAGKSTYVRERAGPTDVVIDLDDIVVQIGGKPRDRDRAIRKKGLEQRNAMLRGLSTPSHTDGKAWFITTAALPETRQQWATMLKAEQVVVIPTPLQECLHRVWQDRARARVGESQARIISAWWKAYAPWVGDTVVEPKGIGTT